MNSMTRLIRGNMRPDKQGDKERRIAREAAGKLAHADVVAKYTLSADNFQEATEYGDSRYRVHYRRLCENAGVSP